MGSINIGVSEITLVLQSLKLAVPKLIQAQIMSERLDAIVFGATGFTGKHAVEELHRQAKERPSFKWGIAGRSQEKLKQVINEIQEETGDDLSAVEIIIADVADQKSLVEMAGKAKVIINTVGPYRFYGEAIYKACLEANTHEVDVSGEPQFMEKMQLQYDEEARKKNIYLISACGYDSIPAEMGIQFVESKFDGVINSVEIFMQSNNKSKVKGPRINFATWESAIYGFAHADELRSLRRQLFPTRLPKFEPKLVRKSLPHKSEIVNGKWCVPFPGCDRSVVSRSQRFLFENNKKRPIQMEPYLVVGSFWAIMALSVLAIVFGFLARFSFGRRLLLDYPEIFTFGFFSKSQPSREVTKVTRFKSFIYAQGWDSSETLSEPTDQFTAPPTKKLLAVVEGTDPGYGFTTACLVQAALTILEDGDKMPLTGGVLTPGAAFAKTNLIAKIQKTGLASFELLNVKTESKL